MWRNNEERFQTRIWRKPLLWLALALTLTALVMTPVLAQNPQPDMPIAQVVNEQGGPAFISGQADYTFPFFRLFLPEPYIVLYDISGYVERDPDFYADETSQVIGQITSDPFNPPFTYELSLPIVPRGDLRDVDNDGQSDAGVMIFTISTVSNTWADPLLEQRDNFITGVLNSIKISDDIDTLLDIQDGKLIIYAPDDQQGFPSGFGPDGVLFTPDDEAVAVPQGYTVVDISTDPFTFDRSSKPIVDLVEADTAELDDFSDLSYVDAFDAAIDLLSREYAFTEYKDIDWDALSAELRPRVLEAQTNNDRLAFRRTIRDLAWSIPDGHVSGPVELQDFQAAASGGLGIAIRELDDGRVLVSHLTENSPASRRGIELGAEILSINDAPIQSVLNSTVPWTSPFSTPHNLRLAQLQFATRFEVGERVSVTYQNPGGETERFEMTAEFEPESFSAASLNQPLSGNELPVEFEIREDGYAYLAIYSFSDDLPLTVALWERAIGTLMLQGIQGLIIDIRQNGGGSGFLGDQLPAYFFSQEFTIGNTARYSENREEFLISPAFEDEFMLPTNGLFYSGPIAVLISPSCASACEGFAHAMTINDRAAIVGHYPTAGLGGSVVPISLPDDTSLSYTNTRGLNADDQIHIEGLGIAPTVRVPVTEETLFSDEDVLLNAALDYLDKARSNFRVREGGSIILGQTIEGELNVAERVQYTVQATEGEVLNFYAEGTTGNEDLNTVLRLYVPGSPEPVAENINLGPDSLQSGFEGVEIPFDVTIIVEVGTVNDGFAGEFLLTVEDAGLD